MFSVCLVDVTRLTNSWSNNSSVMYTYLFVYIIYIPVRVYTNICYIYTYSHILFVFLFSLAWLARLMCSRTRYVSIWFAFFDKFAIIFLFFSLSHIGCMSTGRKNGFNVKNTHNHRTWVYQYYRMNQDGHWVYCCWCWGERAVICEDVKTTSCLIILVVRYLTPTTWLK